VENKGLPALNARKPLKLIPLALCVLIPLLIMPSNSWVINWNQGLRLPDFLNDMEVWLRSKEESKKELTRTLTTINSLSDFMLTFLVVGIVGAIGEELFFRGLIQNKLASIIRNSHLAIWLTAILFSAIHFQFFGFFPRLILGGLLGYLYHWSKNIFYPIIAHLVNNGTTVVLIYLYSLEYISFNVADAPKANYLLVFISLFGTIGGLIFFWKYFKHPAGLRG
jgi:uncharacterized protein